MASRFLMGHDVFRERLFAAIAESSRVNAERIVSEALADGVLPLQIITDILSCLCSGA